MLISPQGIIFAWLLSLLSLALLGGGLYLIWAWYVGVVVGTGYLIAGSAMAVWTFLGREIVLLFTRSGRDEPHMTHVEPAQRFPRPDGSALHVETCGRADSPTLLLTHGWGTNSTAWYYTREHLADRCRLVLWDLPGLGRSHGPANRDYSLEKLARDLETIVAANGDRPLVLAGHSIGGMIMLTFCRLFPQYLGHPVAGLALVDTTYTNPVKTATASGLLQALQQPVIEPLLHLTIWLSPLVRVLNWVSYVNGMGHIASALSGFAGHQTRGQLDLATLYNPLASPAVQARGALAMLRFDARATLPSIPVPVLVAAGHLDRMTLPEANRYICDQVPNARFVELRPAGHMSVFEANEQLDRVLGEFLMACTGQQGPRAGRPYPSRPNDPQGLP
jgi:pimeloyl-ACP methyl ester carboxylesterase